jgi:DNA-binding response OmpR family regulator
MLADLGHAVLEAEDAEAAEALLGQNEVDLVLTDVGLPKASGIDLARTVKARVPAPAIIFASGDGSGISSTEFPDAAILLKPYSQEDLRRVVSAISVNGGAKVGHSAA